MSMVKARVNLVAAAFPLLSGQFGKSVLISGIDQNYIRAPGFAGNYDKGQNVGIPQPYYLHNALPTLQGYQSVGYKQTGNALDGTTVDFDSIYTLRDSKENKVFYVPANGKNYIMNGNSNNWTSYPLSAATATNNYLVTVAFLHGKTYICYKGLGIYTFDTQALTFTKVTITGLDDTTIVGISAANNYLIAWTADTVFWSSSLTETDFTPSLSTGAGSSKIQQVKGTLVACLPLADGFIVYTTGNAVSATFSGNPQFPWVFREVAGSAGVINKEYVTYDSNYDNHIAWTTSGLQMITKDSATVSYPEITDFISSRVLEDFNITTKQFSVTVAPQDWRVKLTLVGSRYVVISYGIQELTHALVYDLGLLRWGKLRITHTDCFEGIQLAPYEYTQYSRLQGDYSAQTGFYSDWNVSNVAVGSPDKEIVFLNKYGELWRAVLDQSVTCTDAVIMLGKFQLSRNKSATMQEIDVESSETLPTACQVITSVDGKNEFQRKDAYLLRQAGYLSQFRTRASGENHSVVFTGNFSLVSLQIGMLPGGDR